MENYSYNAWLLLHNQYTGNLMQKKVQGNESLNRGINGKYME